MKTLPAALIRDRGVRNLVTQWRNLHLRHRECRKRVSWTHRKASVIEKRRRREQWEIVARILEIERQILRWCAKATHDPAIYTPKKGTKISTLLTLQHKYDKNRQRAHALPGSQRKVREQLRQRRIVLVAEMRHLIREWMVAVYCRVHPQGHPPKPLPLHPAELVPRKLKRARRIITKEIGG